MIRIFSILIGAVILLGAAACGSDDGSPHAPSEDRTGGDALAEVASWAYQIQGLDEAAYDDLAELSVDLLVVDPLDPDSLEHADPADVADQLGASSGDTRDQKLVLAYVDVGQAEEHRDYWQDDWEVGDPEWIVATDPDGWVGNYPVAFWDDEWRDLMEGVVTEIAEAGFDGIYLDWVEAYDDEAVIEVAEADGLDAVEEMISFIDEIAKWGHAVDPGFLVVAQNAADLAFEEGYLELVDGIAQEQAFFDGSAGEFGRPGDCPLPENEEDIGSDSYLASLPEGCDDLSTIEVSTAEYLEPLRVAFAEGVPVFTVDYALEPPNVDEAFSRSLAEGFVPYAAGRQLDALGTVVD